MDTTQQDHDNIITLLANVKTLTEEVRLMRDDTKEQVKTLQTTKLDTKEFADYKLALTKETIARNAEVDRQFTEQAKLGEAQGAKIDFLLKVIYIGLGVLGVIEFAAPLFIKYYFK